MSPLYAGEIFFRLLYAEVVHRYHYVQHSHIVALNRHSFLPDLADELEWEYFKHQGYVVHIKDSESFLYQFFIRNVVWRLDIIRPESVPGYKLVAEMLPDGLFAVPDSLLSLHFHQFSVREGKVGL